MASIQDAVRTYSPEVELGEAVGPEEAAAYLAEKTGLEAEQIQQALKALGDLAFWFLVRGRPITLPGVGSLQPVVDRKGSISARLMPDEALVAKMSEPEAYRAGIKRRENIGVPLKRLAQMWNATHPNDPVTDFEPYGTKSN